MADDKRGFFAELKRRNVLRAVVLYAGAAWALSQGVAQLSPALGLPDFATRWFLIACVIGFPFWAAFAWFYEFTPQGFKRDDDIPAEAPQRLSNARTLDFSIIGVLVVAVALLASGYFVPRHMPATTTPFSPPADTLVVLPFANDSGDARQQYFSDGITEELTNALGQNTNLKVIAWNTASRYRDVDENATAIGEALNVANVLTGKILRQGDTVRVIVELVNARTGYQVWADHYDDSLANIFQVQDHITTAIASALKVKFADLGKAQTVNPAAHDLVLRARTLMDKAVTAAPYEQARTLLQQAVALAPNYADAHALLARAWFSLTQLSTVPLQQAVPAVQKESNRALALDPRNVDALLMLAIVDTEEGHIAEAKVKFERALALDPSNARTHLDYGTVLPLKEGLAQDLEAVRLDPDNAAAQNNLALAELDAGDYAAALAPGLALLRLDPHSADNALGLAQTYALLNRNAEAVQVFDLARPVTPLAKALIHTGRLTYQAVLDPNLHVQALAAVNTLGQRADIDPFSRFDMIQLYLELGEKTAAITLLPQNCAAAPVGCNDLAINPAYLSLHGDPRFEVLVRRYDVASKPANASSS